jgi:AcrR family transcriptional regulator
VFKNDLHYTFAMTTETATSPRVQRRRARNRSTMLAAAEKLFAEQGVAAVRIEEIAEASDVSVGSVYTHFGNKDGLVLAVAERILDRAGQYMAQAFVISDSPIEQVAASGEAYLNLLLDYPFLIRFFTSDAPALGSEAETGVIGQRITAIQALLEERIDAAIAAGQVKALDSNLLARFLFGAWNGVVALTTQAHSGRLSTDQARQCLQQARALLIDGMSTPALTGADGRSTAVLLEVPRPPTEAELPTV